MKNPNRVQELTGDSSKKMRVSIHEERQIGREGLGRLNAQGRGQKHIGKTHEVIIKAETGGVGRKWKAGIRVSNKTNKTQD